MKMTEFSYKYWKPNKGYEEQQAEVFNQANEFKFQSANADQIKQLYNKQKIDPKHVRYAFKGETMVGYIQARVKKEKKEIILSYPWTIPGTLTMVRDNLFDEMIQSFKDQNQFLDFQFRINPMAKPKENLEFLKDRGFVEKNVWKTNLLQLSDVASMEYDTRYTSRIGSEDDVEAVISLIGEDGRFTTQFDSDEAIGNYIRESVLKTGHLVLILENDVLTAAGAPLVFKPPQKDEECIILRFAAYNDSKKQEQFIPLFVEVARECLNSGYGEDKPISVYTDKMDTSQKERAFFEQFTPIKSDVLMYYYYNDVRKSDL
jgi:hypothetical protein